MKLFYFPGACSRVTMIALEELGCDYELHLVDLRAGEQRAPAYLSINPAGTVPALVTDRAVLRESAAILLHLANGAGGEKLLPREGMRLPSEAVVDLVWFAATLHPMVRQVRAPQRFTTGDPEPVRQDGLAKLTREATRLDEQLNARWWLGNHWSILDAYLHWALETAALGGLATGNFPALTAHGARCEERLSTIRAIAREGAGITVRGPTPSSAIRQAERARE